MTIGGRCLAALLVPLLALALASCSGTLGQPAGDGGGQDRAGRADGGADRGDPGADQGPAGDLAPADGVAPGDLPVPADARPDGPAGDLVVSADGGALRPDRQITVSGRALLVDGEPLELRGVCWNPVARGQRPPADFSGFAEQDIALMRAAGINAVRTYEPITDRAVLDRLAEAGIWVLMTVYAYGGDPEERATQNAEPLRDHPAILAWLVGNEWNYNGLYTGVPFVEARDRLQRIAAALHQLDPGRPVATVYGELPTAETVAAMPDVDVWGLNVYRGLTFYDLFDRWAERSTAPMFLAEYGADAWDAREGGRQNVEAQAEATRALTREILARSLARDPAGVTLGGTLFEWSDEWWKDGSGSPDEHDVGGAAPGGGPHPDQTFNEEWWGIVDIDRAPRPAYDELRALYVP